MATKLRKIPLSVLRKNLRFSPNLDDEFYSFLENIEAKMTNDTG